MLDLPKAQDFLQALTTARVAGDVDAIMGFFHDDARFSIVGVCPEIQGRDALRAMIEGLVAQFEFLEWRPHETAVHGQTIAVRQHLKVRHRPSGRVVDTETAEFLTIEDGRCRSYKQFADTALIADMSRTP